MTCIIGFTDKENGVSWIGGDSLASNEYIKEVEMSPKVFRNDVFNNVLIGGTTSFRHLNLLKYSDKLFDEVDWHKKEDIDHKFMVTKFIPRVIDLFRDCVVSEPDINRGSAFIVATPKRVFKIQHDYSVLVPEEGLCAVGCGSDVAMGSLFTMKNLDISPQEKIIKALEVSEQICCGVQRPFRILCTDGRDEIIVR